MLPLIAFCIYKTFTNGFNIIMGTIFQEEGLAELHANSYFQQLNADLKNCLHSEVWPDGGSFAIVKDIQFEEGSEKITGLGILGFVPTSEDRGEGQRDPAGIIYFFSQDFRAVGRAALRIRDVLSQEDQDPFENAQWNIIWGVEDIEYEIYLYDSEQGQYAWRGFEGEAGSIGEEGFEPPEEAFYAGMPPAALRVTLILDDKNITRTMWHHYKE